jgi:hypothetical protein
MLKLKRKFLCQMMLLCSLLLATAAAQAGSISVISAGKNAVTLQANGLENPYGIDITVSYDSARLANPRVVQGSAANGAIFLPNTGVKGQIRIAMVKNAPMEGTGALANISFDRIGTLPGVIKIVKWQIIDKDGGDLNPTLGAAEVSTETLPVTTQSDGSVLQQPVVPPPVTTSGGGGSGLNMVGGTLTMPSDEPGARKEPAPAQPQPQAESAEPPKAAVPAPASAEPASTVTAGEAQPAVKKAPRELPLPVPSVLERFHSFSGEKTPKSLIALFDRDGGATMRQSPSICLADGKVSVVVTISRGTSDKAPNFAFNNARYLSLRQLDGDWQIEVVPDKGALSASISMLTDGVLLELPLTVAPPVDIDLDRSGTVNEADFQLFLSTRGSETAPKFDLNGDGKRDYLDDYIFTANYLARKPAGDKKAVPAQQAPR